MARRNEGGEFGPEHGLTEIGGTRSSLPPPEQGRRLVVAFIPIKNADVRDAIVNLVETMSRKEREHAVGADQA